MFPLPTDSNILGTAPMQVCELFLLFVCLGLFFVFLTEFPQHVSHRALYFSPDTIWTLSACFAMWQSFKQLAVTGSCRCFSTPTKQNLFPSCTQPGITWLGRVRINLNSFITLSHWSFIFLRKVLIWNQVWPESEHIFREGVSTAVQEGNLISFAELGGLVLQRVVCQQNSKLQALAGEMRPDPKPIGIHAKQCLITWSFSLWSQWDVDIFFNRSSSVALISLMYFSEYCLLQIKAESKASFFILLSTQTQAPEMKIKNTCGINSDDSALTKWRLLGVFLRVIIKTNPYERLNLLTAD